MMRKLTAKPIAIASDHRGVPLKARLVDWLRDHGYETTDLGVSTAHERVDAMDYALALVAALNQSRSDFAVGICGSGQMMAITGNRFAFIRSALLHTAEEAVLAREHGDANMLALGADLIDGAVAEDILEAFLSTAALGDRYAARRARLAELDTSKV